MFRTHLFFFIFAVLTIGLAAGNRYSEPTSTQSRELSSVNFSAKLPLRKEQKIDIESFSSQINSQIIIEPLPEEKN